MMAETKMIETYTKLSDTFSSDDLHFWAVFIDTIVQVGEFRNGSDVMNRAILLFLQDYPQQRLEVAIQLYKDDEVTLSRAAEIADLNFLDFQATLRERGIDMVTDGATKEEINEGIALIFGER